MKRIKLYPLTLALAAALAAAGCKHGPTKLTQLPQPPDAPVTEPGPTTQLPPQQQPQPQLPPAPPFNPDNGGSGTNMPPGPIATTGDWDPRNLLEDRAALAANTVHFAFDSTAIKSSEQANLSAVSAYLTANPNDKLMIEGNCDERGTEEYNRSLGERRALALREALAKLGIDPQRVRTISFGKDHPADPGHDAAAFAKNRRGDFVVFHPKMAV